MYIVFIIIFMVLNYNRGNSVMDKFNIDFYDPASAIRFIKRLEATKTDKCLLASVKIKLNCAKRAYIASFIEELFNTEHIRCEITTCALGKDMVFQIKSYRICLDDIQLMLNKCFLVNTYIQYYFRPLYIENYDIKFRIDEFIHSEAMYRNADKVYFPNDGYKNSLFINSEVIKNTALKDKLKNYSLDDFTEYNCFFNKLAKYLKKEAGEI